MKNKILNLIKSVCTNKQNILLFDEIYTLCDQLHYAENIKEMAQTLFNWIEKQYNIKNLNFSLFNAQQNKHTIILKQGKEFFLDGELSFYFIINTHTEVNAVVAFCVDSQEQYNIIEKEKNFLDIAFFHISPILQNGILKEQYIEASSIDSVTNVYNRQYLIEHIHKIISLADEKEENITFLMIGIDHFKAVIDEYNYDIGDKVLVELAKIIHLNIKEYDIVARVIGDEFLVALINLPNQNKAIQIAQNIIDQFAKTKIIVDKKTNQTLQKTICIGIASYPKDSDDINKVLKYADNFLYEAKNKGRGSYAVYNKDEHSLIELF